MYVVFRCSCGRHLYAEEGSKTRTCTCGKRVQISKARVLARVEDARAAGDAVRELQLCGQPMTGFHPAWPEKKL